MNKNVKLLSLLLLMNFLLTHCKKDESKPIPIIESFSPASAYIGQQVTITGKNFKNDVSLDIIKFNGADAVVSSASTTQIIATVPSGATTGKVTLTVDGQTGVSGSDFIVHTPSVASFSPASGLVGTVVTINGTDFSAIASDNVVKFNGTLATISNATSTSLTVMVPTQATTGKITVTIGSVVLTSASDFIIPPPTITSFSPAHAGGGSTLVITGTNFISGNLTLNKVKVNNVNATVTAATDTQLTVTVPFSSTTGPITVDVGGQSVISATSFEVILNIPTTGLVAFYPFSGDAKDATSNHIDGTLTVQNGSGGTVPMLAADRFGTPNHCYNFNSSSYIFCGNPIPLQYTGVITVSGWFNSADNTSVDRYGIVNSMRMISKVYFDPTNGGNPRGGFDMYHQGASVSFYPSFGTSGETIFYNPMTDLNTWVFIAVVVNGNSYTMYKNGQIVKQVTGTSNGFNELRGDLYIGSYGGGFIFSGLIDDVAIYNRALTTAEVTQLYQQTVTKY